MMGTQSNCRQPALFSYHIDLEPRLGADHLLRKVSATLDLSFVIPAVRHRYGRSGNVSLDPRLIIKLLLLLFLHDLLYNVPREKLDAEALDLLAQAYEKQGKFTEAAKVRASGPDALRAPAIGRASWRER